MSKDEITTSVRVPLRWSVSHQRWELDVDLNEKLGRGPINVLSDEDLTEYSAAKAVSMPTIRELAEAVYNGDH